jgi:KipI family sensor histidine kinase inhibitor
VKRIMRAGAAALLIEVDDLDSAHRLHDAVRQAGWAGIVDVVPGERTVLVSVDPGRCALDSLAARLAELEPPERRDAEAAAVEIETVYDGADLAAVAELAGTSVEEVIRRHASADYVVAYLGFSPGFGYLTGLDETLRVPREETPRTSVPAGSVAIAGPYTAVYPTASPGGWRLLGRTSRVLWDTDRDPPALLRPGARVRFVRAAR